MLIEDILVGKGNNIHTIDPGASLEETVQRLVQLKIGSLLVVEAHPRTGEPKLVGIITERDILRMCAGNVGPLDQLHVADYMSSDLLTGTGKESVADAMGLMTDHRIRHLPIVVDGELRGVVSIGDLVKAQLRATAQENHYMKQYIAEAH